MLSPKIGYHLLDLSGREWVVTDLLVAEHITMFQLKLTNCPWRQKWRSLGELDGWKLHYIEQGA